MLFKSPEFFALLLLLLPLGWLLFQKSGTLESYFKPEILQRLQLENTLFGKKFKNILLLLSFAFLVIALARPYLEKGEIKVKTSTIDVIVGFDISRSMFANDVYPTRLDLAKKKFRDLTQGLKEAKIGVIGFSSRAFLISPLTEDFNTLDYLVDRMNLDSVTLKGTSIMNALEVTNDLMKNSEKKALVLFTDGGDQKDFSKEIAYAKEHHIVVFIYNIGTKKGGVIKTLQGAMTDKNGNIVIVRLNEKIKDLALQTGGAYMKFSFKNHDIRALDRAIESSFKSHQENTNSIKDIKELFYFPLAIGLLLLGMAWYSFPLKRRKKDD